MKEMVEGERPERPEMAEGERPEKIEMPKGENVPGFSADQSLLVDSGNNAAIKDSDGNVLFSGTAPCDIGYVFFSSADVAEGANYSLMNGETEVETAAGVVK